MRERLINTAVTKANEAIEEYNNEKTLDGIG